MTTTHPPDPSHPSRPHRPSRSILSIIQDQAIRLALAAVVGGALWVWSTITALQDAIAAQDARLVALRETSDARYLALRERTDAAAGDLGRRITTLEMQNAQIMVHVLEVVRAVSRIEARLSASPTAPQRHALIPREED